MTDPPRRIRFPGMTISSLGKKTAILLGWTAALLFSVSLNLVVLYAFLPPPVTPLMLWRAREGVRKIEYRWVPLSRISPYMVRAARAAEDKHFWEHRGFDLEAMRMAWEHNRALAGGPARGGSTITQQTCKNLFLWPDRSYLRKSLELYFTLLVETVWTKRRIMEVYLNVVETGDGIFGVEAASLRYYRKHARDLALEEAAMIAVILPNPRRLEPLKPGEELLRRYWRLCRILREEEIPAHK